MIFLINITILIKHLKISMATEIEMDDSEYFKSAPLNTQCLKLTDWFTIIKY